ncbi:MAG: DUF2058 domain-containing protein [Candidatus Sedimenticola sp. (ex Thyasira tokunagai)]
MLKDSLSITHESASSYTSMEAVIFTAFCEQSEYEEIERVGNSLQDQFLKMGLVDKGKANQTSKEKRKKAKQSRKGGQVEADNGQQLREAQEKSAERDRRLNRERVAEAEKKAVAAQIKQLVEMNRQSTEGGEEPYNFSDENKLKRLYLPVHMHQQVTNGRFAIVRANDGYGVVPAAVAEKIILRDSSVVLVLNSEQQGDEVDDEYADFKVPDDLMW